MIKNILLIMASYNVTYEFCSLRLVKKSADVLERIENGVI